MNKACPACCGDHSEVLESIETEKQHALYLSDNKESANELTRILSKTTTYYEIRKCMNCALEYAFPFIAPGHAWYSVLYSNLPLYPSLRWEFGILKNRIQKDDFVIDYGCGSGQFLQYISDKTQNTLGFDFSRQAIDEARNKSIKAEVIDADTGFKLENTAKCVDHIVAFHVLEHLDNPQSLFESLKAISTKESFLWVAVPSDKRATRLFGPTEYLDQPPHHLTRWNKQSLEKIGLRAGWKLVDFYYEPLGIRTKLWEISRRTKIYKRFCLNNKLMERMIRAFLVVPIYFFKREQVAALSGFSMLACYQLSK